METASDVDDCEQVRTKFPKQHHFTLMVFSPQECIAYGSDCKYYTYYGSNNQCLLYSECSTRACDGDEECVTGEIDCDGGSSGGGDCDLEDAECDGGTTVRVESASDLEDCRQVRETQLCMFF